MQVPATTAAVANLNKVQSLGQTLAGIGERRLVWAELLKAINECLPRDEKMPAEISDRNLIYIDSIDCEYFPDLNPWKQAAQEQIAKLKSRPAGGAKAADANDSPAPVTSAPTSSDSSDSASSGAADNSGWVIEIRGHHYHNNEKQQGNDAAEFVRKTFIKQLADKGDIVLGDVDANGRPIRISTKQLGIDLPLLVSDSGTPKPVTLSDPNASAADAMAPAVMVGGFGSPAAPALGGGKQTSFNVREYKFVVQFAWKPTPLSQREKHRKELEEPKKSDAEEPKVASREAK